MRSSILKRLIAGVIFSILVVAVVGMTGVSAYFTANSEKINRFSVGQNVCEIAEDYTPPGILPTGNTTKKVQVKNTGSVPCYVRVFAEITDPTAADHISANFNVSEWTVKQSDGYYYYKGAIKPGESTAPLFTTITSKQELKDFGMICYAETVQSEGVRAPQAAFDELQ